MHDARETVVIFVMYMNIGQPKILSFIEPGIPKRPVATFVP